MWLALALLTRTGLLHPQQSESREIVSLDGLWRFRFDANGAGVQQQWHLNGLPQPTLTMPVPSSYNDLTQDITLREHVGLVWYERECFIPKTWQQQRSVLYVGSANHLAVVWLNGRRLGEHRGGHLPFHLQLDPSSTEYGRSNRLTIALNNTLTTTTIPPGFVQTNIAGRKIQRLQMDFFHYAGLHRQVMLYSTPTLFLDDILISCRLEGATAHLNVFVSTLGPSPPSASSQPSPPSPALAAVLITLRDANDKVVARGRMPSDPRRGGRLQVANARLWWPRYMSDTPGYLYTIVVEVLPPAAAASPNASAQLAPDVYRMRYGIRTVEASPTRGFLINGQPFYFVGFGKHEDSPLRGRGLDLPQLVKDMGLLQWIGANSVRTTHYPYSDEFLQLCDELGIAVIGEAPAVGLQGVNMVRETLRAHLDVMGELVMRDKNRACVVMWSVANEPDSEASGAGTYFKTLIAQTRALDPSRPVSFASFKSPERDLAAQYVDVIMLNKYHAWYTSTGQLDVIYPAMRRELLKWYAAFRKPILLSEFGADAVAGVHTDPPLAFSEEFQAQYLQAHFPVFDELRRRGVFIGEHVWNFADFMTSQGVTRVVGNRKGVFTRERQPKLAAHTIRSRYLNLANATQRWPLSLGALLEAARAVDAGGGGGAGGGGIGGGGIGGGGIGGGGGGGGGGAADGGPLVAGAVEAAPSDGMAEADAGLAEAEAAVRAVTEAAGTEGGTMDDQLSADGRSAANDVNEATMNLNADLFAASDAVDGGAGAGAAGGGAEQAALGDAGGGMGATHVWQGSS